jgi:hypothetical protein
MSQARRHGIALLAVLAVVSLIAILAVATMAVTTRLTQGSVLAARDARLDAATSYGLATVILEWRQRGLSTIPAGMTRQAALAVPGNPVTLGVTITRLDAEVFWIVAEATAIDDSRRRENLLVRLSVPITDTLPAITAGGDVRLSRWFAVVPDSGPGCLPRSADIRIGTEASLASSDGALPGTRLERNPAASDSSRLWRIAGVSMSTLATTADLVVAGAATMAAPTGVVWAKGDLTLTGGSGQGVLVVNGRLTFAGPVTYSGVIIVTGGFTATAAGSEIRGLLQAGPVGSGALAVDIRQAFTLLPSACASRSALAMALLPRPVGGRSWAELY